MRAHCMLGVESKPNSDIVGARGHERKKERQEMESGFSFAHENSQVGVAGRVACDQSEATDKAGEEGNKMARQQE